MRYVLDDLDETDEEEAGSEEGGAGGFGGAGAGALGAGAAGAVGAGASTFFSFRRMNAACFTMVAGPGPPATAAGGSCATVAMQPAGTTPAARKATALGRSSCCLPANLMAVTGNRVGKTTLFFWQRSMKS